MFVLFNTCGKTTVDWNNYMHELCILSLRNKNGKIGRSKHFIFYFIKHIICFKFKSKLYYILLILLLICLSLI